MEQPEGESAEGLRILARIIARSWAKKHLAKAGLEMRSTDVTEHTKLPVAAVPVLTP